jgi:hypothetical protein
MLKSKHFSITLWMLILALLLIALMPLAAVGQRRLIVRERPRSRVIVYQPRSYVVYQRRPAYSYRTYGYGYTRPYNNSRYYYNNSRYYSYRYSQPYFANRHTYAWANPTYRYNERPSYRYNERWYRERQPRRGVRVGIRWR